MFPSQNNIKGFLGPIGDDLPSLIPLLFALVIFFSIFTYSFNTFDQKSQNFDLQLTALNIARSFRGTSYLSGFCNLKLGTQDCDALSFKTKCDEIQRATTRSKFLAGLIELPLGSQEELAISSEIQQGLFRSPGPYYDDPADEIVLGAANISNSTYLCTNIPLDQLETENPFQRRVLNVISFVFPVALETGHAVLPMRLVVVVWR